MGLGDNRQPLKILHIDPEMAWGGGESQVIGLLTCLSRRGHQNHLLCHPDGLLCREAQKRGIKNSPLRIRNGLDPRPVFPLRRLIRKERYDIVHFHTNRAHALSLWLGRVHPGVRYVATRRMDYPVKRNWYNHYLYNRQVDGVVAISQKIADLLTEGGVSRGKIRVIYSAVEPSLFQGKIFREESLRGRIVKHLPVIGTAAVLEERKGHRFLLEAMLILKERGFRLRCLIAGDGRQKKKLQGMTAKLGLQEDVLFMGFVSDIPAFLLKVDIFVLPSLYEGLGVAVLEAMAAGCPVVATRVGGLPELIDEGVTGFLVSPGDPRALAESILQLTSGNDLARKMGDAARDRIRQRFTMDRMASLNEEYYYDLLRLE